MIGAMGKALAGFATNILKGVVLKPIATALSVIGMWGFHSLNRMFPHQAIWLAQKISQTYFTPPSEWAAFISGYIEQMTGRRISLEEITKGGAVPGGASAMQQLGYKFLHPMLGLIMPEEKEAKENPWAGAERFLGVNLQFQIGAWLLHLLGDIQSFGMFKSLKDLPNAISWSYGIGWLSWLVMGSPFRASITDPMDVKLNEKYRNKRPSPSQIVSAFHQGHIGKDVFVTLMRQSGFEDRFIEMQYKLARKELSRGDLQKLWDLGQISEAEIKQEFRSAGYSEELSNIMTQLVRKDREISLRDEIIKEATMAFEAGEITDTDLKGYLAASGYTNDEMDKAIAASVLSRWRKAKLSNADIAKAVDKDLMTWRTAKEKLYNRGMTADDAEMFLKLRLPKEKWY